MTKTNRKLALYRENNTWQKWSPNDENESPEYIVKLLMTKTNRKLALYRENHMIEMITQWWKRITRVYSKTTYDEN